MILRKLDSTILALALVAIASLCPSTTEALSFDVSSRSTFTSSRISTTNFDRHVQSSTCSSSGSSSLTMKVSGQSKRNRSNKSSHLIELNNERLRTAGRPGQKKFQDPNKVFVGNLPYDATEDDVHALFSKHWNISPESVGERIESIKIIRDWKTGQSKGYGFIQFYEPMVATSAMESINKGQGKGWRIKGRRIRLDQGKRKESEEDERLKKKKKKEEQKMSKLDLDEEGLVIHSVLEDVEGAAASESGGVAGQTTAVEEEEEEDGLMSEDDMITFMEKGGLRGVMPLTVETAGFLGIEGLYEDDDEGYDEVDESYFEQYYAENGYDDEDFGSDLEDEDDDGEELVYDGVFEEEYNPNEYEGLTDEEEAERKSMNREQRRAADKKRKKRKLPFKGFGSRD